MKTTLNIALVFIRDQVRGIPALHRWLTDFVWRDIVRLHPLVLSREESVEIIVREKASVSRFGDGEYKQLRNKNMRRQRHSKELSSRLREILYCDVPNFYAAILSPLPIDSGQGIPDHSKSTLVHNYRTLAKLGDRKRLNAWISLPQSIEYISRMKRVWHNRDIVLVTNPDTKKKAVNCNLFANANRLDFIGVTITNAFSQYESVFRQARRRPAGALFILACGPTATVLAHDLHLLGFQAIDVGSLIHAANRLLTGE